MSKTIDRQKSFYLRFWSKVDASSNPNACWPWTANKTTTGYGMIKTPSRTQRATRVLWEMIFGPIPEGLHVLHHCDNTPCCNPDHLFLGTHAENMADKVSKNRQSRSGNHTASARTHCPQGHEYTPENTTIYRNMRYCRKCSAQHKRNYKEKQRNESS